MGVHETGRERGVAQVDDLRVFGDGGIAPRGNNLVALDDDDTVRHERLRFSVKKARGPERDWVRGRRGWCGSLCA